MTHAIQHIVKKYRKIGPTLDFCATLSLMNLTLNVQLVHG